MEAAAEREAAGEAAGDAAAGAPPAERPAREFRVTAENLADYVGQKVFSSDRLYGAGDDGGGGAPPPPGVVMGLAWTSMGGSSLYIESISVSGGQVATAAAAAA